VRELVGRERVLEREQRAVDVRLRDVFDDDVSQWTGHVDVGRVDGAARRHRDEVERAVRR
jgi:hypothetical protein